MHGINLGLARASMPRGPNARYNFKTGILPAGMVFARASVATDVINGVLTSFSSGQPRISIANGYLTESSRTNSLRNGQAGGSTTGILGSGGALPTNWTDVNTVGLTREIVGSGTINGFSYVDLKLSGTPTAGTYELFFDAATQVAAASGQTWTSSFYIGLIGGSLAGVTSLQARTSGRLSGAETEGTSQSIVPTIDPTRVSVIRTLNGGTTNRVIAEMRAVVTAVPVNATFRIAACQLEQGYGATSYILTTTAAAMRAADSLYIETAHIAGYVAGRGTLVARGKAAAFFNGGVESQVVMLLTNYASNSDYHMISKYLYDSGRITYRAVQSYGLPVDLKYPSASALGAPFSAACSWAVDRGKFALDGQASQTDMTFPVMPVTNRLWIGQNTSADWLQGYIGNIDYYNYARGDL